MSVFKGILLIILGIVIGVTGTVRSKYPVNKAVSICIDEVLKEFKDNKYLVADVVYYYRLPNNTRITYGMAKGYLSQNILECLLSGK